MIATRRRPSNASIKRIKASLTIWLGDAEVSRPFYSRHSVPGIDAASSLRARPRPQELPRTARQDKIGSAINWAAAEKLCGPEYTLMSSCSIPETGTACRVRSEPARRKAQRRFSCPDRSHSATVQCSAHETDKSITCRLDPETPSHCLSRMDQIVRSGDRLALPLRGRRRGAVSKLK